MGTTPIQTSIYRIGGNFSTYNVTTATVIKALPGTVFRIIPNTVGTAGSLVINDNTVTGGTNTIANQVAGIPFGSMTAGVPVAIEASTANGIVVSAVTTGGVFTITWS